VFWFTACLRLCYFGPEPGDSVFVRNVGIALRNYMAPKPKTTPTSINAMFAHVLFIHKRIKQNKKTTNE
jgi:hypothetical protein